MNLSNSAQLSGMDMQKTKHFRCLLFPESYTDIFLSDYVALQDVHIISHTR